MIQIFKDTKYDFITKKKFAYIISGVVIVAGLASLVVHKGPRLGIDFKGGSLVELHFDNPINIREIRAKLASSGFQDAEIQQETGTAKYLIKLPPEEGIGEKIANLFNPPPVIESEEFVGPAVSKEFAGRSIWVIVLGLIVILIYVWIRFTFRWGVCSIIALLHDVLVMVGVLSLCNKEFTIQIIAALLTIIGFSINDTIVIYDRVRENTRTMRKSSLSELINVSVNEMLARTVLTSATLFVVVLILFFFGGRVIHDFTFALLVGIISGIYSTVFVAGAIMVDWERISPTSRIIKK